MNIFAKPFAACCRLLKSMGVGPLPISEIYDNRLFLGSITAASDLSLLLDHGITHVVSVTQFGDGARFFPYWMQYHVIKIKDLPTEDIYPHLSSAIDFINEVLKIPGTAVLVHCIKGRSRSAAVVLAYLMIRYNWPVEQALRFLQWKRAIVDPNPKFIDDLRKFGAENLRPVV